MGGLVVESSMSGAPHIEEMISSDNKKKKRRYRRAKNNQSISACSSASDLCVEEMSSLGGQSSSNNAVLNGYHQPQKEYDAGFSLRPTFSISDQTADDNILHQRPHQVKNVMFSDSSPETALCQESVGPVLMARPVNSQARRKCFPPHWSTEAVNAALKEGQVLRALFRVNAYNRLEAYCKIDGVQCDVLISGGAAQNRAIEGDTVAIIIDPPSLWPRMKGSVDTVNNPAPHSIPQEEVLSPVQDGRKGKNKLSPGCDDICSSTYSPSPQNGIVNVNGYSVGEPSSNSYVNEVLDNDSGNRYQPSVTNPVTSCCSHEAYDSVNSVEKLCTLVNIHPSKRPTGRVVAIVERSLRRDNIVGFLSVKQLVYNRESKRKDSRKKQHQSDFSHGYILLMPTDPKFTKMIVPVRELPGSIRKRLESSDLTVEADLIAAEVVDWSEESYFPEARVIQTFGRGSDVEAQIAAILFENAIDASEFSSEVLSCLPRIPWEIPLEELQSRRDLRNLCIFTIDPATATDLDDALSVEKMSNDVFRVGIHIADVSYFVLPDTALDIDAQIRSTSVYLLQRKLSMLHPMLSENLASLNPGVDRLAFSIFWDINSAGEVLDHWIGRTIIRSCCKLSYEHAQEIIDGSFEQYSSTPGDHWPPLYGRFGWCDVINSVRSLYEISIILREKRFKDGALSLESPKVVFLFDEDGMPYDSALSGRRDSNFLVEEFMLLANRTAAKVITKAYPSCALLRRHPEPNARKLRDFEAFCKKNGLKLDISSSSSIHDSLENIRGKLKNDSILFDILMSYAARPMQLASYFCSGYLDTDSDRCHYALAVPLYTHFTSPLRRYPDIVVHRTLAATLEAEYIYLAGKRMLRNMQEEVLCRCFTGICFHKEAIESTEAQEALSICASKHRIPCSETLADVAAHCNEKKLATRHVKDATNKLCMWVLLKKKQFLYTNARVLGLGPKFMSIYIPKLAIERRILYDDVEGLTVDWLDATSTLVLSLSTYKQSNRKGSPGKSRTLEEVAQIVNPIDLKLNIDLPEPSQRNGDISNMINPEPAVFPLTLHLLSTVPVVLHAIGGDDGPVDIVARLYLSSYF